MFRQIPRVLRACLALLVLGAGLVLGTAGTAGASTPEPTASSTETFAIDFGNDGVEIGTATVSRYDGTDEDTIVVEYTIPGGYQESHLCVSSTPFTGRVSPGQCEHQHLDPEGESGTYTLTVDPAEVVYLQLHVATRGETAYMGWEPGDPFYGNVEVPDVVTCPEGHEAPEGEMVDTTGDGVADNCDFIPVKADCPGELVAPDGEDAMDADGDGVADNCVEANVVVNCPEGQVMVDGECETPDVPNVPVENPATCPDGSTMTDVNGDGVADATDCTSVLPDAGVNPTPATPAEPVPSVLPDAGTPTVVPVAAPTAAPAVAEAEVLGAQVQRAPLARTGSSSTGLAAFGALLVLAGVSTTLAGRRTARS